MTKFRIKKNNEFSFTSVPNILESKIESKMANLDNKIAKIKIGKEIFAAEYGDKYINKRSGVIINKNNKKYYLLNKLSNGQYTFTNSSVMAQDYPNSYQDITSLDPTWDEDTHDDWEGFSWQDNITTIVSEAFENCSSLQEITIPSTVTNIENNAFHNCKSLETITFTSTTPPTVDDNAFANCENLTTIKVPEGTAEQYKTAINFDGYIEEILPYVIFSSTDTLAISTSKNWNGILEYSLDKSDWISWDGTEISSTNGTFYIRGTNNTIITDGNSWTFTTNGQLSCTGNIETLLDYQTVVNNQHPTMGESCFANLFEECTSLVQAPSLSAITLSDSCYCDMFNGCTSLTKAPTLPATTLVDCCYYDMFYGCTSLTEAPKLPATNLVFRCYTKMFYGCTSLTTPPELPAINLAQGCYSEMFQNCTNLTKAPALPATTLASQCYYCMFWGCTSLSEISEFSPTVLASDSCVSMFRNCTSLITTPELSATTLATYCYQNMFNGCTNLTSIINLPATTLKNHCYYDMFCNCSKLSAIHLPLSVQGNTYINSNFPGNNCTATILYDL